MYGFGQFAYSPGSMSDMQNRMNQQYTRPMNNNMMVVPLSGRIVTGIEEARASQIALDGTPSYFPSPAENKIYVKSLDMNGVPITLAGAGLYQGAFNANFTADASGPVTFQLYRNGVAVPGAEATHQATADVPIAVAFPILELVRPSCVAVDNTANYQVGVSAAGTINTANIDLVKQA